jgi:hypothetical protein
MVLFMQKKNCLYLEQYCKIDDLFVLQLFDQIFNTHYSKRQVGQCSGFKRVYVLRDVFHICVTNFHKYLQIYDFPIFRNMKRSERF